MKVIGVIPARMASTRFPGKPLVDIGGKPMIQRVYERCLESDALDAIYVATDHQEIKAVVEDFGGQVMLTGSDHLNGTSRCYELVSKLEEKPDIVINIQGDEPFFESSCLTTLVDCFRRDATDIASLAKKIEHAAEVENPSVVKLVFNEENQALYFSRAAIPYYQHAEQGTYFKHIGIYAYRWSVLKQLPDLPVSPLEEAEKLEQLRWLANGFKIQLGFTQHDSNSVDTPADLVALKKQFNIHD